MIIFNIPPNILIFNIVADDVVIVISLPDGKTSLHGCAALHLSDDVANRGSFGCMDFQN